MILFQKLIEEVAVPLWDMALQRFERKAPFLAPNVLLWNDQVNAEGLARAFPGEHLQRSIELLWFHPGGSQNAKPARFTDRGDDLWTMTEGEKRGFNFIDVT